MFHYFRPRFRVHITLADTLRKRLISRYSILLSIIPPRIQSDSRIWDTRLRRRGYECELKQQVGRRFNSWKQVQDR
ncbi:hypothetical protein QQF64_025275 [Cirrhinus molitorella]|uniref:Uncharacterized protein n=1 Tax=Cirrhinus molitorella TaxID=172907 RepID=A0ABR3NNY8_9TELE